jgi:hypothetical protein
MAIYMKETLINILLLVTFLSPLVLLAYSTLWKELLSVWVGLLLVTLAYPPFGSWLRPHRHSDVPYNRAGLKN